MTTRFGEAAARALVGQRVRCVSEFRGVRVGTTGKVIRADPVNGGYNVAIEWDMPFLQRPPVDPFSRDEYYRYLEEVLAP